MKLWLYYLFQLRAVVNCASCCVDVAAVLRSLTEVDNRHTRLASGGECLWGAFTHDGKSTWCLFCLETPSTGTRCLPYRSSSKFITPFWPEDKAQHLGSVTHFILVYSRCVTLSLGSFIAVSRTKEGFFFRSDPPQRCQTSACINNITLVYSFVKGCQGDTQWKLKVFDWSYRQKLTFSAAVFAFLP